MQPLCLLHALASKNYEPTDLSLRSYLESEWQVLILPWVVGVRGMVDAKSVLEILDFIRVSRQKCAKIVEDETIESVKALYSLHTKYAISSFQSQQVPSENRIQRSGIKQNDSTGSAWHLRNGRPHDSMQQQAAEKRRRRLWRDAATMEEDGE
jgi:hypothetical protein